MGPILWTGACVLLLFGALRWRQAVIVALGLAVFEGALRKWAFPEFGQWIYLAKDALLLGAYAAFYGPRLRQHQPLVDRHPANGAISLFSLLAACQLLNPYLPNLYVGLFGIKAYLVYVPLMYMVPAVFPDERVLPRFWTWALILSLIPLGLGVMQFSAPADSILNRYAWEDEFGSSVAGFADMGKVRITGTFSYITGYTTYLTLVFLTGVAWVIFEQRRWFRWGLYGMLGLVLANLMMTGSRGPFLILGAAVAVLLVLAWQSRAPGRSSVLTLCVVLPLTVLLAGRLFPEARTAFTERVQQSEDIPERLAGILHNPIWALGETDSFGYGIGSTHQATAFLIPAGFSGPLPPEAEGEWERVILEVGPFGFALTILVRILVTRQLWMTFLASQGTALQPYLAAAFLFSLVSIPGSLVFNHTASIFYWFLAGFGLLPAGRQEIASLAAGLGSSSILSRSSTAVSPERPSIKATLPQTQQNL